MTGNSLLNLFRKQGDESSGEPVPPVIIIGAHRSGTTLITHFLEKAGLFTGAQKDPNHESLYFLHLNNWMLNQAGCRWDRPEGFEDLLSQSALASKVREQMRHMMAVPSAEEYLGHKVNAKSTGMLGLSVPWGWKDPRNTITLPVWLKLFPEARVINVSRHGVDVAASLSVRSQEEIKKWRQKLRLSLTAMVTDSARCASLAGAFDVWLQYMDTAQKNTFELAQHVWHVRYEEFLADPQHYGKELLEFCGLSYAELNHSDILENIKQDRAYAYRKQDDLAAFADEHAAELEKFGYTK